MNQLKLIQYSECPPDQFRYKHREDGWIDKCYSYTGWLARIKTHKEINGYEFAPDWKEQAEDQLCRLLPPGWCKQVTGEPPEWFIDARMGIEDVLRGTRVLASFVLNGAPIVSKEVAKQRSSICAGCPFAIKVQGCGPCVGLSNVIADVVGAQTLPADAILENKSCAICKCSARAQAWVPSEYLKLGITDEMNRQFPSWCWKSNL